MLLIQSPIVSNDETFNTGTIWFEAAAGPGSAPGQGAGFAKGHRLPAADSAALSQAAGCPSGKRRFTAQHSGCQGRPAARKIP